MHDTYLHNLKKKKEKKWPKKQKVWNSAKDVLKGCN